MPGGPARAGAHFFNHQMMPVRQGAAQMLLLPFQPGHYFPGNPGFRAIILDQFVLEAGFMELVIGQFQKFIDALGIVKTAVDGLRLPEGWCAGARPGRGHDDIIVRDLAYLPGLGAQRKHLADPRFPDKFFIQFPDSGVVGFVP